MNLYEIIILCLMVYGFIGVLALFCAALAGDHPRVILASFLFWPLFAYYGLRMLVERARN